MMGHIWEEIVLLHANENCFFMTSYFYNAFMDGLWVCEF